MSTDASAARRRRRRRWFWGVGLLVVAGAAVAIALRGGGGPAPVSVVVEPLPRGAFLREVTGSGVVEAVRERALAFRNAGTVGEVRVEEGDPVSEGDPLVRLDVAELERSLASTRASLASARAERERTQAQLRVDRLDAASAVAEAEDARAQAASDLRGREADLDRVQRLFELGAASRDELQDARDARDAAARSLRQAELALESARTRLDNQQSLAEAQRSSADANVAQLETEVTNLEARLADAELRAPFDGVVATLDVEVGDAVGTQPVVTVADPRELRVRATFDENRASELANDQPAEIVPDANTRRRLPARVARLSPVATREGGGAQVEVMLQFTGDDPQAGGAVRPGYTVTARVRVAERQDALLVPLEAITEPDDDPAFVYRVDAAEEGDRGTAERVEVAVLDRNATVAALDPTASPLAEGDPIAVVGLDMLSDGAAVTYPQTGGGDPRGGP